MAAPTHTYVSWASGNDYKGTTFTDGAYTSATKTLVKNAAFAANLAGHWLYLESNDGGSIVAGYYKIATWTDANTVVLATDAGAGVDDDAAKCTQHDGSTTKPWRSVQGALDLVGRDATNGNQINIRSDAAQVLNASLALTTYGTPAEGAPLIFRGYTTAANDGGMGEIDCGGFTPFAVTTFTDMGFIHLEWHTFGNNSGLLQSGLRSFVIACEIHKGASTPSGKVLVPTTWYLVMGCYIHDAGTLGTGCVNASNFLFNTVKDCPIGLATGYGRSAFFNTFIDCDAPIVANNDSSFIFNNSIYSSTARTGNGIYVPANMANWVIMNNIIEGYSGVGGKGIYSLSDLCMLGHNAFYNCDTPVSVGDVLIDLRANDVNCVASPFTNAAAGDFSVTTEVKALAYPGAWPFLATTTNYMDIGAVQREEAGGGGGGGPVIGSRIIRGLGVV
jgi:hypothetical protein